MLKSMTGYGRNEKSVGEKTYLIEIRSLNGKQFEILLRIPPSLKPYEFDIRSLLSEKLLRGTIECIITLKQNGATKPVAINTELARAYYQPLAELSQSLNLDPTHILSSLLKLPEVVVPSTEMMDEKEWDSFREMLLEAIRDIDKHRSDEGSMMEKDLILRIDNIRLQQEE